MVMILISGDSEFEFFIFEKGNLTEDATAASTENMPMFQMNFLREGRFPEGILSLLFIIFYRLLEYEIRVN